MACTAQQGPAKAAPEVSTSPCFPKRLAQEDTPIHYPADEGSIQGPLCPLDSNLSHFILVEPGGLGSGDGLAELRLSLEKHISQQRTGYGGKAHSSCTGSILGMRAWRYDTHFIENEWERAFQEPPPPYPIPTPPPPLPHA